MVLWDRNWQSFIMEKPLDSELLNLKKFLKNFEAGNLRAYIKSEAPPAETQAAAAGDVKVAVGTTFKKIVLDAEKVALRPRPEIIDLRTY